MQFTRCQGYYFFPPRQNVTSIGLSECKGIKISHVTEMINFNVLYHSITHPKQILNLFRIENQNSALGNFWRKLRKFRLVHLAQ